MYALVLCTIIIVNTKYYDSSSTLKYRQTAKLYIKEITYEVTLDCITHYLLYEIQSCMKYVPSLPCNGSM